VSELVDRFRAEESRGSLVSEGEDQEGALDSLTLRKFMRGCFADIHAEAPDVYNLVTGFDVTAEALRLAGERIVNLKKEWRREDDALPARILADELPSGVGQGVGLTRGDGPDGRRLLPHARLDA
jgi:aldehyde:ferredoxin oxidoreductase